jgi:hypothetical protein
MPAIMFFTDRQSGPAGESVRISSDHIVAYFKEADGTRLCLAHREPITVQESISVVDAMFARIGFQTITKELHSPSR